MAPVAMAPPGVGMPRFRPLTTPAVSVLDRPKGLPIANTDCPTLRSTDVPTCSTTSKSLYEDKHDTQTAAQCKQASRCAGILLVACAR